MFSRRRRAQSTELTPRIGRGKVGVTIIEIRIRPAQRVPKASPYEHRVASPDRGMVDAGDRSARRGSWHPRIGGRIISPPVTEITLTRIDATPYDHPAPGPDRGVAESRRRPVARGGRCP